MPLIMALCVILGILIGTFYTNHFSGNKLSIINSSGNKLNNLLHIINDQYVDTVSINGLVEKALTTWEQSIRLWTFTSSHILAADGDILPSTHALKS